jgi:hypothetical protein
MTIKMLGTMACTPRKQPKLPHNSCHFIGVVYALASSRIFIRQPQILKINIAAFDPKSNAIQR